MLRITKTVKWLFVLVLFIGTSQMTWAQHCPTIELSSAESVCETESFLVDATIANDSIIKWTTNGDGNFINANLEDPTYILGSSDISLGHVTLKVSVIPFAACGDATIVTRELILTIIKEPAPNAGSDGSTCIDTPFAISGASIHGDYSSFVWSHNGNGTFSNESTLFPTYIPSVTDNGTVTITLTANAQSPCNSNYSDFLSLTISNTPTVDAGSNTTICENQNAILTGSATDYNIGSIVWTTTGDGHIDDPSSLNTTYTPGVDDITNGQATLTLTVDGNSPCSGSVSDDVIVFVNALATADAGLDIDHCGNSDVQLSGSAENYSSAVWTTSGSGTFDSPTILNPIYTPSANDVAAGSVDLTLTATGSASCANIATSTLTVTLFQEATVNVGGPYNMCELDANVGVTATADNVSGVEWTSDGDGSFISPNSLITNYVPGTLDKSNGTVNLTITGDAVSPCVNAVSSSSLLTIFPQPTSDAGNDQSVCSNQSYTLVDAIAQNYSTIEWSTNGDGNFNDVSIQNPTYTPGAGDIANGSVSLTMRVTGTNGCTNSISDAMILSVVDLPTVNVVETDDVCENDSFTFTSSEITADNYTAVLWSGGTGIWVNDNTLYPTYTPGATDISNGSVVLTVTVTSAGCAASASDQITLNINSLPTVNAGVDMDVCENETSISLNGNSMNYSSVLWTTSNGAGIISNANTLNATYPIQPSDIVDGYVNFTLNATGQNACSNTVSDDLRVSFIHSPVADAGNDATICSTGDYVNNDASAVNYASILWSTNGDGSFVDDAILNATYQPGSNDILTGNVRLTLTAIAHEPCNTNASDYLDITIIQSPSGSAGNDKESCGTDAVILSDATASDYANIQWTTDGDGTFFPDATSLNPTYNPTASDVVDGSIILTSTINGNSPCDVPVIDNLVLTLHNEPTVYAGIDDAVCSGNDYTVSTAVATDYSSIIWTTSGDGLFSGGDTESPVYTPGSNDIAAGTVSLSMNVTGIGSCNSTVSDVMQLDIDPIPVSDAGVDVTICSGETYVLAGSALNYSTFSWSHTGTGNFTDNTTLTPSYTPSASDIANGTVTFTLSVTGHGACTNTVTSDMTMTIVDTPVANAGTDQTICENNPYTLLATASNYSLVHWTTSSATGSFSDPNILNPSYIPTGDAGSTVTLTLTAEPDAACSVAPVIDEMLLTVTPQPIVFAGFDDNICSTLTNYPLTSSSESNTTSILWTTSGDGNFSDDDILHPIYHLGTSDIANGTVTLTLTGSNATCGSVTDNIVLTINSAPIINAGDNQFLCDGAAQVTLATASGSNYSNVTWSLGAGANGSFVDANVLNATYNINTLDYNNNYITLNITATAISPCSGTVNDQVKIYFENEPTVDAGSSPITICEDDYYQVTGMATNYSSVIWDAPNGDGTWQNPSSLIATYRPGTNDRINGSVVLRLTANPNNPCTDSYSDEIVLNLEPLPVIDAGDDATICQSTGYVLSTSSAVDYSTVSWTTSGSGSFDDNNVIHPIYTPSAADAALGVINLTLTATSNNPCNGIVSDNMVLNINSEPTVDAGTPADICGNGVDSYYLFDANATDYTTVSWTNPGGDGHFDNATIEKPVYTPGPNDIINGSVTLEMTAFALLPCTGYVSDQVIITINTMPTADVGADASICEGSVFTRTASATDYSSLHWITSGSGSFNNDAVLGITYTPSAADIAAGSVTLSMEAYGNSACLGDMIQDDLVLSFVSSPSAYAGEDEEICEDGLLLQDASASNYSSILWTSSGTSGTILNANTITPTYIPSATDIAAGNVTLTLTASPNSPCSGDVVDTKFIVIKANSTAYAGADVSICENEDYTVVASDINVTNESSIFWTSNGDGSFINYDTETPTYTPGSNDIANGSVTITLHAVPELPCSDIATDSFILNISPLAIVDAGDNTIICNGSTYITTTASVSNASEIVWTSSGTGSFNNSALLNTEYTPSDNDVANGSVILTLTATSCTSCNDALVSDNMIITFQPLPTADAGSADIICENTSYIINDASATNYSTLEWSTNGDGVFTNGTTLVPTYVPGPNDVINGSVVLTLTANASAPCSSSAISQKTLTISPTAEIFAGDDNTVCEGESYTIIDATATDYSSILWSTTGSGIINNASSISPTYTPDANDVANGTVVFTLTAVPNIPCTQNITDQMVLSVLAQPTVDVGEDQTICEGSAYSIVNVTATDYTSLLWTTNGTGTFSNNAIEQPIYYPSPADEAAGSVVLALTAIGDASCPNNVSDSFVLNISNQPVVEAGSDVTICKGDLYTANATIDGSYTALNWTHNGNGTLTGAGTLTPVYQSASNDNGDVTLTLTVTADSPCLDVTDQVVITVQENATVDVGEDVESCENSNYQIAGVTVTDYSSVEWTTNGTGVFSNNSVINPEYIPSAADITNGSVILTLTATSSSPCSSDVSDWFELSFIDEPAVNAGSDIEYCEGQTVIINGASATNFSSLLWTTSGTGSFTNGSENSINCQYEPSNADIIAGVVTLTLNVNGNAPCASISDDIDVHIQAKPISDAGDDATICDNISYTVNSATAQNYSILTWTSTGSGTLIDGNTLTPTYTPSVADIASGQVSLTLTATAVGPCNNPAVSSMILFFQEQPEVNAGVDKTICEGNNITLSDASVSNYSSVLWTSSGTGSFTSNTDINPTYQPSIEDYTNGTIVLTLTALPSSPCTENITDELVLTLISNPIVDAGDDGLICEGNNFTVTTASASDYYTIYWTTTSTGVLSDINTLTPTYIPDANDIANGAVTLTLHAEGDAPCGVTVEDNMLISIQTLPLANAGADADICDGNAYTISDASAENESLLYWTTSGSGDFLNGNTISPTYTPSQADFSHGSVDLMLHVVGQNPCSDIATDVLVLTLFDEVTAFAGDDAEICEGSSYTIADANITNYSIIEWTTNGDGTYNNTGAGNPVYTPGINDIANGSVTLSLSATGIAPCDIEVTDELILSISTLPIVDAGVDKTVCESNYTISDASATNYSSLVWTTNGSGTLTNENSLTPTYTASAADIINGPIVFTLEATSNTPCVGTVSSTVNITFEAEPTVFAGNDASICIDDSYQISDATVGNESTILWSTSGDGTFIHGTTISPTYTPGIADINNGTVTLTVVVGANAPCVNSVTDEMVITISNAPQVNAGEDREVCEGNVDISNATATNYSTLIWNTDGTGSFSNSTIIDPTYIPSEADIANGSVVLSLTATATGPCTGTTTDDVVISFIQDVEGDAGVDASICSNDTYVITSASANYFSSVLWSTSGTGTFGSPTNLVTEYAPSAADIANGSVVLSLTVSPNAPCTMNIVDDMTLTIDQAPTVNAGVDYEICSNTSITVTDATATNYSTVTWGTDGDGTFTNINSLTPTYTPGPDDVLSGNVTLTIYANPTGNCSQPVSDEMILTVISSPTASVNGNNEICEDETYTPIGTADNYSSIFWSTSGNGTFSNVNTLMPTYIPSSSDINNGSVILSLNAVAEAPCVANATSQLILNLQSNPIVNAGSDANISEGESFTPFDASAENISGVYWETTGSGLFTNIGTLSPTYTPSAEDIAAGQVSLSIHGTSEMPCTTEDVDVMVLTFTADPIAFAGEDAIVCEGDYYVVIDGSATNVSDINWITSGSGTIVNANTANPTYIPSAADISNGNVVLTMNVVGILPNTSTDSDNMILSFEAYPDITAGEDVVICEGDIYTVSTAMASNYSSISWISNGSGTLNNSTTLTPTYIPSDEDVTNGLVTLTMNVIGINPCSGSFNDQMEITLLPNASVDAGVDIDICQGGIVITNTATASDYVSVQWLTNGNGVFSNPNSVINTYTPGSMDISNGGVVLTLQAQGNAPCSSTVSDDMVVNITISPSAFAGSNEIICEGDIYTINDATANNYSLINWTTSGTGYFTNGNTLSPSYTPSNADIISGSVTLTMNVIGDAVCPGTYSDDMVLTIVPRPVVDAGDNAELCVTDSYTVTGASVANYTSYSWSTNGAGMLINTTSLSPTYIPDNSDTDLGQVLLTLTAQGQGSCAQIISDVAIIDIIGEPVIDAGPDCAICDGDNFIISQSIAADYSSILWTHTGEGQLLNANTVNPIYVPAANDYIVGNVLFTMIAQPLSPCMSSVSDIMVLTLVSAPDVNAGSDAVVCDNDTYTLSGASVNGYSQILWTTNGDGTFNDPTVIYPIYTPGTQDIVNGSATLTISVEAMNPCTGSDSDQMVLSIVNGPTVNAGSDASICESGTYLITDASAQNYSSYFWTTSGDGSFINSNTLNPEYIPGAIDKTNGSVVISLNTIGTGVCTQVIADDMMLTLEPEVFVDNGIQDEICENQSYNFSGVTVDNYSSMLWTSSGTGLFSDDNIPNPTYTPSASDISAGSVVLTLTASSVSPCNDDVSDDFTLLINDEVTLDAGSDVDVSETGSVVLSEAVASDYSSLVWTTSGDGTFSDINVLNPTYTPGANDIVNGTAVLTLTANSQMPCSGSASDNITVTIVYGPTAFAGNDAIACSLIGYYINDATASNYSNIVWHTSGNGNFNDIHALNPIYTPSVADLTIGTVTLTMNVTGIEPNTQVISDEMTLDIYQSAEVFAGNDAVICEGDTYSINDATANSYVTANWNTSGTGTFNDATLINPVYTPSAQDIADGHVLLTIKATGNAPCDQEITDMMILDINMNASVDAGVDMSICGNQSSQIQGASASNYTSLLWTSSGTGSFSDATLLEPLYTPSEADNVSGNIVLTLTSEQNACGSVSDDIDIQVIPGPAVDAGGDAIIPDGSEYSINDASASNYTSLLWTTSGTGSFNDSSLLNPTYTPSAFDNTQGTVVLTLIGDPGAFCSDMSDLTLSIMGVTGLDFTFDIGCATSPVNFYLSPTTDTAAIVSYSWNFGDGLFSSEKEPTHIFALPDSYNVELTVIDTSGNSTTVNHIVVANDLPHAYFDVDEPVCAGNPVQFTDYSTTASGYINMWHWDFGDGNDTIINFPDDPNVTHVYSNNITYNVTLTVETSIGCINDITIPVSTVPSPVAMFDYDEMCEGIETQFTDISVTNGGGEINSWTWDFNDPLSGVSNTSVVQNPTHTFSGDGDFNVSLIISNTQGCMDTIIQTVTVAPTPDVEFSFGQTCLNDVTYFFADMDVIVEEDVTQWQWDFGDGASSNVPNPEHYYNVAGSYDVTLTIYTTAGCVNSVVHTVIIEELPVAQFDYNVPACNGAEVEFINYSHSDAGYITSWNWDFGDGNSTLINFPDNPNVNHLYDNIGDYNVTLTVTTINGCSDDISKMLTVVPNPVANFDFDNTCENEAVVYTDLSQSNGAGVILSWYWDFGDPLSGINNTSELQNPYHTYTSVGHYTTTLTIETDNGCSNTYSKELTISESPAVDFDFITSCLNDTTDFTCSTYVDGRTIDTYYWDFGDGATSDVADPGHVYNNEGTYAVILTIVDTAGCTNSISHDVEINPLPVPAFTFTGNTCSNAEVLFADQSYSSTGFINQWIWDFGDGTDTTIIYPQIPDVGHLYANDGDYVVTLTVIDDTGCTDFITNQVSVLAGPLAEFSFNGSCLNEEVSFTDQSVINGGTGISGWTWNFDDPLSGINNQSTLQNPTHFFTEADTFNVQLVISNTNGCTDTIFHQVGMSAPPAVAIEANDVACQGMEMLFRPDTLVTDTAAIATFDWSFGDGTDHIYDQNPLHIFELVGQYQVTLLVEDTLGCTNSTSMLVVVDETPVPNFSYSTGCVGGATQFTDYSYTNTGTAITQWSWDFGDANALPENNVSIQQNPVHTYEEDGTYSVKLVVQTSTGCQDSILMDVIVHPSPQVWFAYDTATCQDGLVYFQDSTISESSTIVSWHWQFEEGYQSDLQNPSYTFSESDKCYDVELIAYDALGCSDTAIRNVCVPVGFAVDFESTSTCLNDTTYFNDSLVSPIGDSIILLTWDFGDPGSGAYNVSTEHNPYHYYAESGSYNVTLEATNINNCMFTINHTVNVYRLPDPVFTYVSYLCDSTVYFKNESIGNGATIVEWVWNYGDGSDNDTISSSGNPNVTHRYDEPGKYLVTLQVTNGNGCSNIFADSIFREPCLTADFELLDETVCHTRSIEFADSSRIIDMITQWNWDFGDGQQQTYDAYQPNIVHSFADTGTFNVALTVRTVFNGYDRENTYVMPITVHPTPYAQYIADEICFGDSVRFIDNTSIDSANINGWYWDFGMENISTDTSTVQYPYYEYSEEGIYQSQFIVTNEYGCSDTAHQPVTVHQLPTASFVLDNSCRGDATYFYDNTDTVGFVGEISQWHWDFGIDNIRTDTSDVQNPEFVFMNEGSHDVTLIVTDEYGCGDSVSNTIITNPIPIAAFSLEKDYENMQGRFNITNESEQYNEYEWNFGTIPYHFDQEFSVDDENPVIVYEDDGIYDIQLIVWNEYNCPDTVIVTDSLLFKGLFIPTAFSPNNPYESVRVFKPSGINLIEYEIQIYGVRGNLIWQSQELDSDGSPTETWDGTYQGTPLPEGVYVWKVRALFKDGSSWQGKSVGSKELSSGERYGTVTLIR